jgi:hypothetical protein
MFALRRAADARVVSELLLGLHEGGQARAGVGVAEHLRGNLAIRSDTRAPCAGLDDEVHPARAEGEDRPVPVRTGSVCPEGGGEPDAEPEGAAASAPTRPAVPNVEEARWGRGVEVDVVPAEGGNLVALQSAVQEAGDKGPPGGGGGALKDPIAFAATEGWWPLDLQCGVGHSRRGVRRDQIVGAAELEEALDRAGLPAQGGRSVAVLPPKPAEEGAKIVRRDRLEGLPTEIPVELEEVEPGAVEGVPGPPFGREVAKVVVDGLGRRWNLEQALLPRARVRRRCADHHSGRSER